MSKIDMGIGLITPPLIYLECLKQLVQTHKILFSELAEHDLITTLVDDMNTLILNKIEQIEDAIEKLA